MRNTYSKGFGAVEAILVVLVVVLAGALAYVYFSNSSDTKTDKTETSKEQSVKESVEPDTAAAAELVKTAYDEYVSARGSADENALANFKKNVTSELAATLDTSEYSHDPVLCAQSVPASLRYSAPSVMDGSTMITVTTTWQESPDVKIGVMVDGESGKIASITCLES